MQILKLTLISIFSFFTLVVQAQSLALGKKINISNNDSFSGFEILDAQIDSHRLVISGEDHRYVNKNIAIETKLLRYLIKKKGFKHLLIEQGFSLGQMLNKYMITGDSILLKKIQNCSDESYYRFSKNLRTLNNSLADSQKFTIECIDVERFYDQPVSYMNYLLPKDKKIPEDLILDVEALISLEAYLNKESNYDRYGNQKNDEYYNISVRKSIRHILRSYDSLNTSYKAYLGANFNEFDLVIKSISEKIYHETFNNMAQGIIYREQYMFKKFEGLANKYPNDRFFGQFGRCHATDTSISNDCDWYEVASFIKRVNQNSNFKTPCKAFAIGLTYPYRYNSKDKYYETSNDYTTKIKSYLNTVKDEQNMLFPIYNDTGNSFLKNRFKYILVSKESIEEIEVDGDTTISEKKEPSKYDKIYEVSHIGVSYGQLSMDISKLNSALGNLNFETPLSYLGFSYLFVSKDEGATAGLSYFHINEQSRSVNTDTSFAFSGYNFGFQLGYDLVQKVKKLSVMPLLGFDFQQLKLTSNIKDLETAFPYSSSPANQVYKNPKFIFSPQLDVRLRLFKGLWLGAKSGYHLDFNTKDWKLNGKRQNTSAQVNQSGLFFEGIISIGIEN